MAHSLDDLIPPEPTGPTPAPIHAFDVGQILEQLQDVLKTELQRVIPSLKGDLTEVVNEIGPSLITAAAVGDEGYKKELEAQLALTLDIHKIEASKAALRTFGAVSRLIVGALSSVLTSLVPTTPQED